MAPAGNTVELCPNLGGIKSAWNTKGVEPSPVLSIQKFVQGARDARIEPGGFTVSCLV
jgi:hypothetical protein